MRAAKGSQNLAGSIRVAISPFRSDGSRDARPEAGPRERWPKMLKGKLEKFQNTKGPSRKTGIVTA